MGLQNRDGKKKEKKEKVIPPTEAVLRGQFTASVQGQQRLRDLDTEGGELQKALGVLELDYLAKRDGIIAQFEKNRQAFQQTIADIGKEVGANFSNPQEPWNFDFKTMAFTRVPAPPATPTAPAPKPKG